MAPAECHGDAHGVITVSTFLRTSSQLGSTTSKSWWSGLGFFSTHCPSSLLLTIAGNALMDRECVPLSPTGSGKSLSGWEESLGSWESGWRAFPKSFQDLASVISPNPQHIRSVERPSVSSPPCGISGFPIKPGGLGRRKGLKASRSAP